LGARPRAMRASRSRRMPFPAKAQTAGRVAARKPTPNSSSNLAVRPQRVSRLKQAYHELHHPRLDGVRQALPGGAPEHLAHLRSRYAVGRAGATGRLQGATQFSIFETQLLRYQQERDSKEIEIAALLQPARRRRIEVPEGLPTGELTGNVEENAGARAHQAPALEREQKVVDRNELAANLGARATPGLHRFRALLQQGGMLRCGSSAWISAAGWRANSARRSRSSLHGDQARHDYEARTLESRRAFAKSKRCGDCGEC